MNIHVYSEEEREEFLKGRRPSCRAWYSRGRSCSGCGRPIVNSNRSGQCPRCNNRSRGYRNGEGAEHRNLKVVARQFLEGLGCQRIQEECVLGSRKKGDNHVRLDILGYLGNEKIAVECGGSGVKSLGQKIIYVDRLYILPYGESEPFLWRGGILVCHSCGHKI